MPKKETVPLRDGDKLVTDVQRLPGAIEALPTTGLKAPTAKLASGKKELVARRLLRVMRGEWLEYVGVSQEARRYLPSLFVGLFVAEQQGQKLSKREACTIMGADVASTGPKYIDAAEQAGLIRIEKKPPEDRRKDFLHSTPL